jgi:hypothetical protein
MVVHVELKLTGSSKNSFKRHAWLNPETPLITKIVKRKDLIILFNFIQ